MSILKQGGNCFGPKIASLKVSMRTDGMRVDIRKRRNFLIKINEDKTQIF